MRKKAVIALCFTLISFQILSAHPPTEIQVEIDTGKGEIMISGSHEVKGKMDSHYIDEIEIELNGDQIIEQKASVQTGSDSQVVVYRIPGLKSGDQIEIQMKCNYFGSLKRVVTVP